MMRVKKRLDSSNYCYYFSFCIYLNRGDFINYTVKSGDTLYGISNQFGVSVVELANLNNVTASTLKVGQVLIIPTNSGTNPNNLFLYTVVSGDSLYKIARKYNTTVDEIVKLNNLKSTGYYLNSMNYDADKFVENYGNIDLEEAIKYGVTEIIDFLKKYN